MQMTWAQNGRGREQNKCTEEALNFPLERLAFVKSTIKKNTKIKNAFCAFETPDKTYPIKLDNGEKLSSLAQFDINIFEPILETGSTTLTLSFFLFISQNGTVFIYIFEPSQRYLDP